MTIDTKKLKAAALACGPYSWQWWNSNSFRRLTFVDNGRHLQDGGALCAVVQPSDGHPDVLMAPGVRELIELCSPETIYELCTELDRQQRGEAIYPIRQGKQEGRLAESPWHAGDVLPAVGSYCLVSGTNCDIESDQHRGYSWRKVIGYSTDRQFVCFQTGDCWPTVERTINCWFAEIPHPAGAAPHPAEPVVNQSLTTADAATGCVREALEAARNGLQWYRDSYPDAVDGSDDEADELIDRALAALAQPTVKESLTVDDWKLMPKEYTEAMEHAGVKALEHACETLGENLSSESMVGVVYNAMYAAQPTTQQSLQDAEPMKVPDRTALLVAIQRYADERASMTKAHCTGAADNEQRDASDRTAQAYSDMCVMLGRYGAQPAASAEPVLYGLKYHGSLDVNDGNVFRTRADAEKFVKQTAKLASLDWVAPEIVALTAPVAAQPSVPDGYRLLPEWKLRRAIGIINKDGDEHGVGADLEAMLEAAPTPPTDGQS